MTSGQSENGTIVIDMNRSRVAVESAGSCNSDFLFLSPSLSYFLWFFHPFYAVLQIGRSLVRSQMVSVDFSLT